MSSLLPVPVALRHIEMILAPGPDYKAIRLVQETRHGQTVNEATTAGEMPA